MTPAHWFTESRFGMFVHWGLYALPARHEWVMTRERISTSDYRTYFEHFEPDRFDPRRWARAAKDAGMKYVVLTTKHHEGFCLWDSALTDYKSTNTPIGKDLVVSFVEAVRDEGLKVGFYYSLIDWHHDDFPIDGLHPRRDEADVDETNSARSIARYREYLHGQVRELLTNYGRVDYLFFDYSYPTTGPSGVWGGKGRGDWDSPGLLRMVRQLQPDIVVNDRLDIPGDIVTPEQYQPTRPMTSDGEPVPWEACQTINGSWGYDRDNHNDKPADLFVRMLIDGVSNGGNLLLNVGPTGRGDIDRRAAATLAGIGDWMALHGRSIYGASSSEFTPPADARYTQKGNRLYLHLFAWPLGHVHLPGVAGRVTYAQMLDDASEVAMIELDPEAPAQNTHMGGQPEGTLTIKLPTHRPDVAVPVIELFLAGEPRPGEPSEGNLS